MVATPANEWFPGYGVLRGNKEVSLFLPYASVHFNDDVSHDGGLPLFLGSLFCLHCGSMALMSRWPRSQKCWTARAIPRQEKKLPKP
ncbi:hypothetical protein EYF80_036397 [Liparis tanakae]|uniref:Uncharacterized protein n=1 Tax=Liparis tanakae TaxID=230148 RepID=A0A4Z2GJJ9_9TELE|nr:hypothetical protein EYF80_036397 [Liparis tanakae]